MELIRAISELVQHDVRAAGAPALASIVGGTHICLFICDPELHRFLPGPGFPQRLPNGVQWTAFLRSVAETSAAQSQLQSPFTGAPSHASGYLLNPFAIVVFFGDQLHAQAFPQLAPGLELVASLLNQEVRARLSEIQASLAHTVALESRQLATSLSEAHDKLSTLLRARESLLQEVNRQHEQLQLARRISGIGIWEVDLAARTVSFSAEASAIFGLPPGDSHGPLKTVLARIHPDDRPRVEQAMSALVEDEGEASLPFRVLWQNDVTRWVENRASIVRSPEGAATAVIGLSLDITQRMLTEDALVRSEKLAAAGRLAASIAHEINNPLEGLVNLIYLAQGQVSRDITDLSEVRKLLAMAEEELIRTSNVARQALSFYRDINMPVCFEVDTVIAQVAGLIEKQLRNAHISLQTKCAAPGAQVDGWPGEIKQALSNLLINAAQASAPGAVIHLRRRHSGGHIRLSIADYGHGIPQQHLQRVFEPFFSTKRDSGSGLGLWVTRQIVEKHGGSIRVRSSQHPQHRGTVFLLTLPIAGTAPEIMSEERHLRYRWLEMNP